MTEISRRKAVAITDRVRFGAGSFVVMAGPCAVESRDQLLTAARSVAAAGAAMLRGGVFKPRTSPHSFQGLGEEGLRYLAEASRMTGLPVVTEVLDPRQVELVSEHVAMLQVGSRNMQNFPLLREVGRLQKPILLKRGAAATLDELLAAADYVLEEGNTNVVLCERGVRSFDPATRYLLDLSAVPLLQSRSPLPVVVDPSHGTGNRDLVMPMVRAALAAGADGVLVEVHPEPQAALSDGPQALEPEDFSALMAEIRRWISPTGRYLAGLEPLFPSEQPEESKARAR
ncbi:MAG: 3-deoxy-7-phosphoheptulonate synthase [Planctomycetota bacterium]